MSELPDAIEAEQVPERTFPWRCPRCRQKEVRRTSIPYQCQRLHHGRSVTLSIPQLAVPRCANCGQLVFDYLAEEQINRAFREFVGTAPELLNGTGEAGAVAPAPTSAKPPVS
jgi:hypothetical protein